MWKESFTKVPGWASPEKQEYLYLAALACHADTAVEVGVYGGRTLLPIAQAMCDRGRGTVWGIDPYSAEIAAEDPDLVRGNVEWTQESIDAALEALYREILEHHLVPHVRLINFRSCDAWPVVGEFEIDLLHIDGNHLEPVVTLDCDLWVPRVREGGLIVMDDTNFSGVAAACQKLDQCADLVHSTPTWATWKKRTPASQSLAGVLRKLA